MGAAVGEAGARDGFFVRVPSRRGPVPRRLRVCVGGGMRDGSRFGSESAG